MPATAQALQAEIPGLGTTVAVDVKHIYAWVQENTPKASVHERCNPARQPRGDPDCRLGVKRRSKQERPDGPSTEQREYLWGYGTGVVAATDRRYGDVVLAARTQPCNAHDSCIMLKPTLPWGTDRAVFDCTGWHATLEAIAGLYREHGTARAMAVSVNASQRFDGRGPYRFNEGRADFRFYLRHNVAYYRLVDMVVPQAISHWYLGSGGTVGFHTITGMAALHDLVERRARGGIDFQVWPQEGERPDSAKHLLVESYPAIYPRLDDYGPCHDDHEKDAWRVLQWLLKADEAGSLSEAFDIAPQPFGRYEGANFQEQIRFEGWILGVTE